MLLDIRAENVLFFDHRKDSRPKVASRSTASPLHTAQLTARVCVCVSSLTSARRSGCCPDGCQAWARRASPSSVRARRGSCPFGAHAAASSGVPCARGSRRRVPRVRRSVGDGARAHLSATKSAAALTSMSGRQGVLTFVALCGYMPFGQNGGKSSEHAQCAHSALTLRGPTLRSGLLGAGRLSRRGAAWVRQLLFCVLEGRRTRAAARWCHREMAASKPQRSSRPARGTSSTGC
jgi:hypothetical protein